MAIFSVLPFILPWSISATVPVAAAAAVPAASDVLTPRVVSEIRIHRRDVYDPEELGALGTMASLANALHITTREGVVRDLLLFEEGDTVDERLLHESEALLRGSRLFRTAGIAATPVGEDSVIVDVTTRESWSTRAVTRFNSTGGNSELTLGVTETNLLGTGDRVSVIHTWADRGNWLSMGFQKNRFLTRRTIAGFSYSEGDLGIGKSAFVGQPWYGVYAPWNGELSASSYEGRAWVYDDGEQSGQYSLDREAAQAYTQFYSGNPGRLQVGLGFYLEDRVTRPLTGETLQVEGTLRNDRRRMPLVSLGFVDRSLVRLRYVDGSGLVEDHAVGSLVSIMAGAELQSLGSTADRPYISVQTDQSVRLGDRNFAAFHFRGAWHWRDNELDDRQLVFGVKYFSQPVPGNTVALRGVVHLGEGFYPEEFLYLGAENGLRGYRFRQFRGKKAAVANLENRFYSGLRLMTFSFGLAGFVDAGYAWEEDEPINLDDVRMNVGFGLRIGGVNMSRPFRLDVARGVGFDGEWTVTFTSGELFGLIQSLFFPRPLPVNFGTTFEY